MRRCKKRRYRDRIGALLALADTQRKGRDEIRVYHCRDCKGWHLTSKPRSCATAGASAGAAASGTQTAARS